MSACLSISVKSRCSSDGHLAGPLSVLCTSSPGAMPQFSSFFSRRSDDIISPRICQVLGYRASSDWSWQGKGWTPLCTAHLKSFVLPNDYDYDYEFTFCGWRNKKIKRQIRIVVVSLYFVGQGLSSTPVDNDCPWAAIGHNSRNGL